MNNSLPKLLITGGNGQLAQALLHHARNNEFHLISCARNDLDIIDASAITTAIKQFAPDMIVNTAAYTAVDKAESEINAAQLVNHLGAKNLAIACAKQQIPLIHLSTDYVFNGKKTLPYQEEDATNPINVYGKSKCLGEEAVREHCQQHIILRVSGIFSTYGNNFFKTMLKLAQSKTDLRVIADQITCPTHADDIANAIFTIAKSKTAWGTYHFCSAPSTSWHEFAETILNRKIKAITTSEYRTAAKRPPYSVLDCSKIKNVYGISQPSWKEAIEKIR